MNVQRRRFPPSPFRLLSLRRRTGGCGACEAERRGAAAPFLERSSVLLLAEGVDGVELGGLGGGVDAEDDAGKA